jgi:hypothetical protein
MPDRVRLAESLRRRLRDIRERGVDERPGRSRGDTSPNNGQEIVSKIRE